MDLSIGLIFKMKNVKVNSGMIINIYKLVDIDYGFYFYINKIHTFLPINNFYSDNVLYLVCEDNKKILGDKFNVEGIYAGHIDRYEIERLLNFFDNDFDKVKEKLFEDYGNKYLYLKEGFNFNIVQIEENIRLVEDAFNKDIKIESRSFGVKKLNIDKNRLSKYGTFLTDKEYLYNPAIGRDEEIKRLEMVLLSYDTNALLVGDAGVGKTAIVEGLAYRIKNGLVHEKLKDVEIISINSTSMIAGARYVGDKEKRLIEILDILKNNKKIIMFTDEIHTLEGAGTGDKSNLDVANILKPYIERGDIKIIGSTTVDEYNNVMNDNAFKSRFKKINVNEPDVYVLKCILNGVIGGLEKYYNIKFDYDSSIKDNIYNILIEMTSKQYREYCDKSNNPRLVLSILKDVFANALYNNRNNISVDDIVFGINECDRIYKSVRERFILELKNLNISIQNNERKKAKVLVLPNRNLN